MASSLSQGSIDFWKNLDLQLNLFTSDNKQVRRSALNSCLKEVKIVAELDLFKKNKEIKNKSKLSSSSNRNCDSDDDDSGGEDDLVILLYKIRFVT
jgi:hypothetical protein